MATRKTHEEFLDELKNRPITVLGMYTKNNVKIKFKCNRDGHEWMAIPASVSFGKGCPACAGRTPNKILRYKNNWVLIDVSTRSHPNSYSWMDAADFNNISAKISMSPQGYPSAHIGLKNIRVHKLLNPLWKMTDHINRNKADNRRINLREVTCSQNFMNKGIQKNNKSGIKGVHWDKSCEKWMAYIKINKKHIHLGHFDRIDFAEAARLQAEQKYFGEYSPNLQCN